MAKYNKKGYRKKYSRYRKKKHGNMPATTKQLKHFIEDASQEHKCGSLKSTVIALNNTNTNAGCLMFLFNPGGNGSGNSQFSAVYRNTTQTGTYAITYLQVGTGGVQAYHYHSNESIKMKFLEVGMLLYCQPYVKTQFRCIIVFQKKQSGILAPPGTVFNDNVLNTLPDRAGQYFHKSYRILYDKKFSVDGNQTPLYSGNALNDNVNSAVPYLHTMHVNLKDVSTNYSQTLPHGTTYNDARDIDYGSLVMYLFTDQSGAASPPNCYLEYNLVYQDGFANV